MTVGGEAFAGRDVYGQSFSRLSGFVRYGGDSARATTVDMEDEDSDQRSGRRTWRGAVRRCRRERQPGAHQSGTRVPRSRTARGVGPHFGLGARRAVSANNDLGVRLELDAGRRALADRCAPGRLSSPLQRFVRARPVLRASIATISRPRPIRCTAGSARSGAISFPVAAQMGPGIRFSPRAEHRARSRAADRPAGLAAGQLLQDRQRSPLPLAAVLNPPSSPRSTYLAQ